MSSTAFTVKLASHPILRGASAKLLGPMADCAVARKVSAGQLLCGLHERTGRVWFLVDGLLHATIQSGEGSAVTIDVLRPGEVFGYLNCWMHEGHIEDVSGLVDAEVIGVPAPFFTDFVRDYQPAAHQLLRDTAARMRSLMRLRAISTQPARTRIAAVLDFLTDRIGPTIPMTRQTLASVAGLTTETVSRTLAPLRKRGIIELHRGHVIVKDLHRLHQASGAAR